MSTSDMEYIIIFSSRFYYFNMVAECGSDPWTSATMSDAVTEVLPVIGVIKDLKVFDGNVVPVYEDNSGAVGLASRGKFTKRAKHIEVAYKFVYDYISKGIISIIKVHSTEQLADILTKALGAVRFMELRRTISIA